ncbi:cytosine permease [Thioalkalivibrio sp. ALJ1]|uniref:cytosine permease n=1 Tax=Thioalkalivibrio sp. ALJ1 TaxID=1158144 RepID=UPI000570D946|nr:cytosine permease [Thioalkalivibrio sp. ALJ1]
MPHNDHPLSEVPAQARKGFWSITVVLFGFTFFTSTLWAGGSLGTAFSFGELMLVIALGNLLLGAYAATLAYIGCKSGLHTVLMGRFCFGEWGSKLSDVILAFTQIGWYAWGTATVAMILVETTALPEPMETGLMVVFGLAFCITAMIGYRGLDWLSRVAVPVMLMFILFTLYTGFGQAGGVGGLLDQEPTTEMGFGAALTIVIGTFVGGATLATNWTRFARTPRIAVIATLAAFVLGNGLMVLTGALGALVYHEVDIVHVMLAQGFVAMTVTMLLLNIWSTQDNTIYNFGVAGCNLLRTQRRRLVTVLGAVIGTGLAVLGMYDYLVPFLILLGTFIPPLGGVIMADFWLRHRGRYPALEHAQLASFHWPGLLAYGAGSVAAFYSPVVPPVIGVLTAALAYMVLTHSSRPRPIGTGHRP